MNSLPDSDSEDELPPGWEERATLDGKVFYANHETKSTQWVHPRTGKQKRVTGELPYGWEKNISDDGHVYYVDHENKKTTYTDPRLAFAVEETDSPNDIRQRYDGSSTALQVLHGKDLNGKIAIVTGGTSGIGYETVKSLASHGAEVIIPCRDILKGEKAKATIKAEKSKAKIVLFKMDLASLKSIENFCDEFILRYNRIDIMILNAGTWSTYDMTGDGFEKTFQINHLSQFYMTQLLKPILLKSAPSRIVIVSSESHRFSYLADDNLTENRLSPLTAKGTYAMLLYNDSKLCNLLFSNELERRLGPCGVHSNAVHPGNMVLSGLQREFCLAKVLHILCRPFTKSLQQASATSVFCATAPELEGMGGMYFNNCCRCQPSDRSENEELAKKLWELSEQMIERWRSSLHNFI